LLTGPTGDKLRITSEEVMRLRTVLPIVVVAIHIAACGSHQHSLTAAAAANMRGRQLVTTVPKPAAFLPEADGPPHGLLALALMQAEGDRIRRENAIADPAELIAKELSEHVEHGYGVKMGPLQVAADYKDPTQIAFANPSADLILEIRTDGWRLEPFSHFPRFTQASTKFGVKYMATLRLIDAKSVHPTDGRRGIIFARGTCSYSGKETPRTPTYDQFLADGARRLIRELDLAAQFCIDEFRSKVLTPTSPP
jgi:hypothetical protein